VKAFTLRIATRSSPLALWQAEDVATSLRAYHPELVVELVRVETLGDRTQRAGTPLHMLGGQGVFVKEVQAAVLRGDADVAVHSAKDLPSTDADGLVIAAFTRRDDVRDGLVGCTLAALPSGATVATGSVRRRAQLAGLRPDLRFVQLRGNMHTRVAKAEEPDVDAVVAGCAGLDRLGLGHLVVDRLDPTVMVPQVAQAAIAVECRADDCATLSALMLVDRADVRPGVVAERAFLARLGSGCDLPVGALAVAGVGAHLGQWTLSGLIASLDGVTVLRKSSVGHDVVPLGVELAEALLAAGGGDLLQ